MTQDYGMKEDIVEVVRGSRPLLRACGAVSDQLLVFQLGLITMAMQCGNGRIVSAEARRELEDRLVNSIDEQVEGLKRVIAHMERLRRKCTG